MMNIENIKNLEKEAESYAKSEYEKWVPTPDFSGVPHIRSLFNKKFAELIWQEAYEQGYSKGVSDSCEGQGV